MSAHDTPSSSHPDECKPLLDACTPSLYARNAFRITGLTADASAREIKRRIDDLKHAEEFGSAADEHKHAFALEPPPTIEHIREAAHCLLDPERRLVAEFFWFWPLKWGTGRSDAPLVALSKGDKATPFKLWWNCLSEDAPSSIVVAKHNLAVMYHLVALDSETYAIDSDFTSEQTTTIANYWRTSFKWWEELTNDEIFWSLVSERIRILDDRGLTTGFARRMRATLPEAMDKINAMLAIAFAKKNKLSAVAQHIAYMKETHQGQDNIPRTLSAVITPMKARVVNAIERARDAAERDASHAATSARELLTAVHEPVKLINLILPPDDVERIDICDSIVDACLTCQVKYARETKDWNTSLLLIDDVKQYAASNEASARLTKERAAVSGNLTYEVYVAPLAKSIESIDSLRTISEKTRAVQSQLVPYLQQLQSRTDIAAETYDACADIVARYLRGLSVSTFNETRDIEIAMRILEGAISLARGSETVTSLQDDKGTLLRLKAEQTKQNLHMQIRGDDIEVTTEFVRCNSISIPASKIDGMRGGVFIEYTNGSISKSSYLIDVASNQAGRITIECKRFFRSDAQARSDFDQIFEALLNQIAPAVIRRLADNIAAGGTLTMGPCVIHGNGIHITTGALLWKKETFVPWSLVRHGINQGQLTVFYAKDHKIAASMALRDTWNAVFFESIADAVKQRNVKKAS